MIKCIDIVFQEYILYAEYRNLRELQRMVHNAHRHLPRGRSQLVQVLAAAGDVIRISDVAKTLSLSGVEAAKRLARWKEQGLAEPCRTRFLCARLN